MNYVDQAFEKMREAGEITATEQRLAKTRHHRIRDKLEAVWDIDRTFLTGSYDRHTKIKPLEDVDIFAVVKPDGAQGHFRHESPDRIITALVNDLDGIFKNIEPSGMAALISMSDDDGQATFELVPAFDHAISGFDAPDPDRGHWIRTDPNVHAQLTTAKNAACSAKWVPFVKMVKGWNRQAGKPIPQSFLIEVMSLRLVHTPFGRYQDEFAALLGNIIDSADGPWADPADLGPDVDELLTPYERQEIRSAASAAAAAAEEAIYLEDNGQERKSVDKWREIFGDRMPLP
jgi:hypothetical protein